VGLAKIAGITSIPSLPLVRLDRLHFFQKFIAVRPASSAEDYSISNRSYWGKSSVNIDWVRGARIPSIYHCFHMHVLINKLQNIILKIVLEAIDAN